ncbi:MAG: hypothetical protein WDZ64_01530 [Parcubacteria group bacterium]
MKKYLFIFIFVFVSPISVINAQSVDLLSHGNTYTPPFYKGATLWSNQSEINFVAIPQGLGSSANLNYRWTRNGTVLGEVSGLGRSSLSFFDTVFSKPQTVGVEIVSSTGDELASAIVTVVPISPRILIYENSPLYGILFHREVGREYQIREGELTLEAIPLFFTTDRKRDGLVSYEWKASGTEINRNASATYRAPSDAVGSSLVEIEIVSGSFIMQNASRNLRLEY